MTRKLLALAMLVAVGGWPDQPAEAQDTLLREIYGRGVHSYFARDYRTAHTLLSAAIDQGTKDPRAFYFRGLTLTRLGRPEEAEADYKKGAEFEAQSNQPQLVDQSLERIQGRSRVSLETHRQVARATVRMMAAKRAKERYEQVVQDEKRVLRNQAAAVPPPQALPATPAADANDPFAAGGAVASQPAAAPPAAAADPFGGGPAVAAPPAADPFGGGAAAAAPAAGAADPFGAAPPAAAANPAAAADPFGAAPAANPPAAADPFGAAPAANPPAAADPFGAAPAAAPAANPPAAVDPFGAAPAAAPAANPAAAVDPFGAAPAAAPAANPAAAPAANPAVMPADKNVDPFADDK